MFSGNLQSSKDMKVPKLGNNWRAWALIMILSPHYNTTSTRWSTNLEQGMRLEQMVEDLCL